jgi:hypothetical protein
MGDKRVPATVGGKHVTAAMLQTLADLHATPQTLDVLSAADRNRFHALRDKGLATLREGMAVVTADGAELIRRKKLVSEAGELDPKGLVAARDKLIGQQEHEYQLNADNLASFERQAAEIVRAYLAAALKDSE